MAAIPETARVSDLYERFAPRIFGYCLQRLGSREGGGGARQETVAAPEGSEDELIPLEDALADMPETQRRALLLREWQGLSYREIAAELEVSQSAVETLIFRARRSLARRLEAPRERSGRVGEATTRGARAAAGGRAADQLRGAACFAVGRGSEGRAEARGRVEAF